MTDKQLLARYLKEQAEVVAKRDALDARLSALDGVIGGLRVMVGEVAPRRRPSASAATGTKALILDVLAGDVVKVGKSRATTYGIP